MSTTMATDLEPFWMVWCPAGRAPVYRHPTPESATLEAERLARLNPGQTFVVLESTWALRYDSLQRIDLRPGRDVPF